MKGIQKTRETKVEYGKYEKLNGNTENTRILREIRKIRKALLENGKYEKPTGKRNTGNTRKISGIRVIRET